MRERPVVPPFDRFLATAEAVVLARPGVDPAMVRELFLEVATVLDDGMALEGLDEHDADAVVGGLCDALVTDDPGAAVRDRAATTTRALGDLHDPDGAAAAYLTAAQILQI